MKQICDVCQGHGFYKEPSSGEWVACLCVLMPKSPFADPDEDDDEDEEDTIYGSLVLAK